MMYRLEAHPDEWIDRANALSFEFEGARHAAFRGDTLSSALAAAGVPFLARSFKYHRPRHVLSFANHDSNVLLQVDGVPNVRADVTLVQEGMRAVAVNTFGGLEHDKARILDRFARWLPVGFYYKAFHSKRWFPRWERTFRALTGLGAVTMSAPRCSTPKRYAFCDVLVVGGGPSGLSAALTAAAAGARVVLVEESLRLGGTGIGFCDGTHRATQALVSEVAHTASIAVFRTTIAAAYYADHWVALADGTRLTKMRARSVVLATGAAETPAVFRNNDLPGIMLATAAWKLLLRYRVAAGRCIVMIAANAEAYRVCLDLHSQGVRVSAIVELREQTDEPEKSRCADLGMTIFVAHAPYQAVAGSHGRVAALDIAPLLAAGRIDAGAVRRVECDAVLMSVGWSAASQLFLQAGGTTRFSEKLQQFVPKEAPAGTFAAGRMNGAYDLAARLADGARAGAAAARHAGYESTASTDPALNTAAFMAPDAAAPFPPPGSCRRPSHPFPIIDHPDGKNFVDFDEDLQVKDLENAAQEGFDSSELLKRYSTVGMGPSQGKHSNLNALRVLGRRLGLDVGTLGTTTSRPMYHPIALKLLAGRGFSVERRTAVDALHAALGAVWTPAGNWRRPEYYASAGESRAESLQREVQAVRNGVGLIDVGTLGKIEVYGPQAGAFLDQVYTGKFSDLDVGMTRYALMVDESGVIVDDGVVARLQRDAYYFTTTTTGSATVFRELLRLNALWGLDCALVNVTGHRSAFNFAGPASRDALQSLTDVDLGDDAFPFLAMRSGLLAEVPARLLRVGFVGELGYEIHVASSAAATVWQALCAAGQRHGLRPFGVEAQRILRLEKGHFIVGQDTDGLTDPFEAGARWAVHMQKPYFVGQRSLKILGARGPRQSLVGVEIDAGAPLPKESHLIIEDGAIAGRLTSVAHSHVLGRVIGLAMVAPGLAETGRVLHVRVDGETLRARVARRPFYDPNNSRQRIRAA